MTKQPRLSEQLEHALAPPSILPLLDKVKLTLEAAEDFLDGLIDGPDEVTTERLEFLRELVQYGGTSTLAHEEVASSSN